MEGASIGSQSFDPKQDIASRHFTSGVGLRADKWPFLKLDSIGSVIEKDPFAVGNP